MTLRFSIQPQEFKRIITNVLEFTKERKAGLTGSPYYVVQAQREGMDGTLAVTGLSRYAAGNDWVETQGASGDQAAYVLVQGVAAKSDVIDDLTKLANAGGGTSTAKSAQLSVSIEHRQKISVWYGDSLVGELADVGEQPDYEGRLERVGQLLEEAHDERALEAPTAMLTSTMALASKVKAAGIPASESPVADMARLPTWDHLVLLRIGATFTGLLSTINRELYAVGGKNHDGYGKPEHLLGGEKE